MLINTSLKKSAFKIFFISFTYFNSLGQTILAEPNICKNGIPEFTKGLAMGWSSRICNSPLTNLGTTTLNIGYTTGEQIKSIKCYIDFFDKSYSDLLGDKFYSPKLLGSSNTYVTIDSIKPGLHWGIAIVETNLKKAYNCFNFEATQTRIPIGSVVQVNDSTLNVIIPDSLINDHDEYSIKWGDAPFFEPIPLPFSLPLSKSHIYENLPENIEISLLGRYKSDNIGKLGCPTSNVMSLTKKINENEFVDIELASENNVSIIQKNNVINSTIEVKNNGNIAASNIKILINIPYKEPISIFQSYSATKGIFEIGNNIWQIPTIDPGETIKLDLFYKILFGGVWYLEAEVYSIDQSDIDSTPFNQQDLEDDFSRTCISVPIDLESSNSNSISIKISDPLLNFPLWNYNGNPISQLDPNNISINNAGVYSFFKTGFKCPTSGCCPFIIQNSTEINNCCFKNVYFMERTLFNP